MVYLIWERIKQVCNYKESYKESDGFNSVQSSMKSSTLWVTLKNLDGRCSCWGEAVFGAGGGINISIGKMLKIKPAE